ncbi:glycosyl hydrolase-related protein [Bacillus sp. DX1.1]|uniref:glycosyl hydrolase-related protein n=1 Tax=unclassified Bacillus (in: firmicutes) TaxID=185979 RepID=UPI002570A0DD|nr:MULTISPECIES: glycosyl hydrolase-related protein [unclassified Bacillus (in: firmicutes)]MDM5153751.1 glycosyl hydrolase-related protein [Bacillus sp. DX1.1]WJE82688.1 glycosyl hydrolase-related protein [Bacillus sp. DX3.1]
MKLNNADVKTPVHFSFLQEAQPEIVLSTLKKAEKDDQFVLRFYNATDEEKTASFELNRSIQEAHTANLNEKPLEILSICKKDTTLVVHEGHFIVADNKKWCLFTLAKTAHHECLIMR